VTAFKFAARDAGGESLPPIDRLLFEPFIPPRLRQSAASEHRARIFLISHLAGPPIGLILSFYLLALRGHFDVPLAIIFAGVIAFWAYPLALRFTARFTLLSFLSLQHLTFVILFVSYQYGGVGSPFFFWLLMVPLFGFFYLGDVAKFRYGIISTLTLNVALFAVICRVLGHPAFALPAADGDVLNLVSVLGAGAYVMMMALSYSRLLEHQDALQEKSAAQRLMAEQLLFAKEAAEAASRAKSEFLAVTSHELRTPLNAIIGFSQLALRKPFGPLGERYADYLKDIEESGTHLLELINDILDVAKAESGRFDLYEEACDVRRVIASSLRLLHRRAMRAKLAVTLKVPDTLPLLMADARRLKQMLLNLLGNAIKFTPPGGTILIEAGIEKDGVLAISISDSGIGIGEKHLENVLEPFFQVDSSHARSAEGVGLGLPLVASIIARHGGTLRLTSELGEGTTATLRFPSRRVVIGSSERLRA